MSDRHSIEQPPPEARLTLNPHCGLPQEAWTRVGEIAKRCDLSWFQLLDDGMIVARQDDAQRFAIAVAGWAEREGCLLGAPICSMIPLARRAPPARPDTPNAGEAAEEQSGLPTVSIEAGTVEGIRDTENQGVAVASMLHATISDGLVHVEGTTSAPTSTKGSVPWFAVAISLAFLGGAFVQTWPGVYYTVLRFVVCFTAAGLAADLWEHVRPTAIGLLVAALVFNPLLPLYLGDRGPWLVIDGIAGVLILIAQLISRHGKGTT